MAERTDTPATEDSGQRVVTGLEPQWCYWHSGPSGTATLINVLEQSSGPGIVQYACASCQRLYGLTPYADKDLV